MKVIVIGDTHGKWKILNHILKHHKDEYDLIIQCGDFGFWPTLKNIDNGTYGLGSINTQGKPLYFIDGNHEHHNHLDTLTDEFGKESPINVYGDIFYIPRGCVFEINGKKIMGVGGAYSIDKIYRIENRDWFKQEVPSYEEEHRILSYKGQLDYLISHTIPHRCVEYIEDLNGKLVFDDITRNLLDEVVDKYKPEYMFCGHWHVHQIFDCIDGLYTKVEILNNIDDIDGNLLKLNRYVDRCYKFIDI